MSIGAVILAAGKGSRIGYPKWQLKMPTGEYFYEYLCNAYTQFGCETVLVVNSDDAKTITHLLPVGVKLALNSRLDLGRLYSLQCGLKKLSPTKYCFVHNIDNPYVSTELLTTLLNGLTGCDYTLPQFEGKGGHPLLISSKIAEQMISYNQPILNLKDVLIGFQGKRVDFDNEGVLQNINTENDLTRFKEGRYS